MFFVCVMLTRYIFAVGKEIIFQRWNERESPFSMASSARKHKIGGLK
jgi:hypothetical protein